MSWPSIPRKWRPVTRLPTSRPCISHMQTSTVSTWPARMRSGRNEPMLPDPPGPFPCSPGEAVAPSSNSAAEGAARSASWNKGALATAACDRPLPGERVVPLKGAPILFIGDPSCSLMHMLLVDWHPGWPERPGLRSSADNRPLGANEACRVLDQFVNPCRLDLADAADAETFAGLVKPGIDDEAGFPQHRIIRGELGSIGNQAIRAEGDADRRLQGCRQDRLESRRPHPRDQSRTDGFVTRAPGRHTAFLDKCLECGIKRLGDMGWRRGSPLARRLEAAPLVKQVQRIGSRARATTGQPMLADDRERDAR